MKLLKRDYWPLYERIQMQQSKVAVNLASLLLKKDIEINNVKSYFNIYYTNSCVPEQAFDLHMPTNIQTPCPCVFYFHGGAWMSADKNLFTPFCKRLASAGFAVCNINYRLLPNVEIEDCIDDCIAAVKFIINHSKRFKIDTLKLYTCGDSAGAHLASYTITQFLNGNAKVKRPFKFIGCGLYYGVFDFTKFNTTEFPILKALHKRYVKAFDKQEKQQLAAQNKSTTNFVSCINRYKGSALYAYYARLSPVTYLTSDFPPSFLTSGRVDKLNSQTMLFIKHLKKLDINYSALIFPKNRPDGRHAFLNLSMLPSAKAAFEHLVHFFYAQLEEPTSN